MLCVCLQPQMLLRSAQLVSGQHGEEAWYLVNLFQRTQPIELLQICHHILATFLELNYEYFDEGWPLTSRLNANGTGHTATRNHRSCFLRRGRSGGFRPRSPFKRASTSMLQVGEVAEISLKSRSNQHDAAFVKSESNVFATPKRRSRLAWLRGKATANRSCAQLLPSKPTPMSTPTCTSFTSAVPTSIEQVLRIGKSPACKSSCSCPYS